ncbi:hypothetical protein Taro_000553, partial [Colocasia esculenta]|nr:hypothetical protein [Colocasia esculenta]
SKQNFVIYEAGLRIWRSGTSSYTKLSFKYDDASNRRGQKKGKYPKSVRPKREEKGSAAKRSRAVNTKRRRRRRRRRSRRSQKGNQADAPTRKKEIGSEIVKIRFKDEEKISSFFLFFIFRTNLIACSGFSKPSCLGVLGRVIVLLASGVSHRAHLRSVRAVLRDSIQESAPSPRGGEWIGNYTYPFEIKTVVMQGKKN